MATQVSSSSCLSNMAIRKHMDLQNILISPFTEANLSTSSYDVTLGANYFRETASDVSSCPQNSIFNPYSEKDVKRVWGEPKTALSYSSLRTTSGIVLDGFSDNDSIILIGPGETILGHTNEFIGGRNIVTTMMKARSSMGRCYIEVCKCAGWGDVGYTNRWTMEITNNSKHYTIPLCVGRRIAQIVFFEVEPIIATSSYDQTGKYQTQKNNDSFETLIENWEPADMLPRMYQDREAIDAMNN